MTRTVLDRAGYVDDTRRAAACCVAWGPVAEW